MNRCVSALRDPPLPVSEEELRHPAPAAPRARPTFSHDCPNVHPSFPCPVPVRGHLTGSVHGQTQRTLEMSASERLSASGDLSLRRDLLFSVNEETRLHGHSGEA